MKKALIFLGPPHWLNALRPVADALQRKKVTVEWFTANAESSFETGIQVALPETETWHWLPSFAKHEEVQAAYHRLSAYARTQYEQPSAMACLPPSITDRVTWETASDATAMPHLLDKVKPDVCIALHELGRWGMLLGYWCARKGIPYFTTQEGMYYGHPWIYTGHTKYSTSLVWGEATKKLLLTAGADKVEVIGHPGMKAMWEKAAARKDEALASIPAKLRGRKFVTIYMTHGAFSATNDLAPWLAGLEEAGYAVLIRIAIMANMDMLQKVQAVFTQYPSVVHVSVGQDLLWPYAAMSEVVIVLGCSTFTLEALWRGLPVGELANPAQPFVFSNHGLAAPIQVDTPCTQWIDETKAFHQRDDTKQQVQAFLQEQIAHDSAADRIAQRLLQAT